MLAADQDPQYEDDNDDHDTMNVQNEGGEDPVFLALALPAVLILSLWPLIALFRDTGNPTSGFDIDMFMALKGILDSNTDSVMMTDAPEIIELPALSPAEQLVGAIFGPP